MNPVDIVIVVVLILSALIGFQAGLIQSVASLFGLVAGIAYASWNFRIVAARLMPLLHDRTMSEALGFCLLVFLVMLVFALIGMVLKKIIHGIGLGWLDRLIGMLFGFLQGALLVTLGIVTIAAFYPTTQWMGNTQLGKYFLGSVHLTTQMTPHDLKQRIMDGLHVLQKDSPVWLHPD